MIIVTGGAGMIGSNIIKALNERGITDILVVDHLKNGRKFKNLVDLQIADYMDRDDFLAQIMAVMILGSLTPFFMRELALRPQSGMANMSCSTTMNTLKSCCTTV